MKSLTATAKKFTSVSLLIMLIPFLFFVSRVLQQLLSIPVLPDAWLEKFSQDWPAWLRIVVFAAIVIMLPLTAVILNLLSLIRLHHHKEEKGIRLINFIVITVAGLMALLFTTVMLAD
jgi:membrane protease YdiL (CAAX protease family)